MSTFNYTGRVSLERDVAQFVQASNGAPLTVYFNNTLADLKPFAGCEVVLEAHFQTRAQRLALGKVEELAKKREVVFGDFADGEGVLFSIKLVEPGSKKIRAIAERFTLLKKGNGKGDGGPAGKKKSPIGVKWAEPADDLGGRFWKLALSKEAKPTILLKRGKFKGGLSDVNTPMFSVLAKPAIVKEALTYAFIEHLDGFPAWARDWYTLGVKVLGVAEDAPDEEPDLDDPSVVAEYCERTEKWIDRVAGTFAQKCDHEAISSDFKRI